MDGHSGGLAERQAPSRSRAAIRRVLFVADDIARMRRKSGPRESITSSINTPEMLKVKLACEHARPGDHLDSETLPSCSGDRRSKTLL